MNRVRFLVNAKVNVTDVNGKDSETIIPAGSYQPAHSVETVGDGYYDVVLENGSVIYGIRENAVELHGTPVVKLKPMPKPKPEKELVVVKSSDVGRLEDIFTDFGGK